MKKRAVLIVGILIVFFAVFLFIFFQRNISGFNVLKESTAALFEKEIKLDISGVDQVIVYPGDKKQFSFIGINSGDSILTNCKLLFYGDYNEWIVSSGAGEIPRGESKKFYYELTIPETASIGNYKGKAEINCDAIYQKKNFDIVVSKISEVITINEVKNEEQKLLITYSFDHTAIVGEGVAIDVWLVDDVHEVARDLDAFTLQKEGIIQRTFVLALPDSLAGNYKLYLAVDAEPEKSSSREILLGELRGTGFSIIALEKRDYSLVSLAIIIFIVCGAVLFMRIKNKNRKS